MHRVRFFLEHPTNEPANRVQTMLPFIVILLSTRTSTEERWLSLKSTRDVRKWPGFGFLNQPANRPRIPLWLNHSSFMCFFSFYDHTSVLLVQKWGNVFDSFLGSTQKGCVNFPMIVLGTNHRFLDKRLRPCPHSGGEASVYRSTIIIFFWAWI